jgi:NADPH2:quinone reductase
MKAVICKGFGSYEDLVVEEWPEPHPGMGEVCVAPEAWGLNYVDVIMVGGTYQLRPDLPFIPGGEAAGKVVAIGADVSGIAVGDRVMTSHRPGAFAELVVAPTANVIVMPDTMPFEEAAGFRAAFATAYHGLVQGGRLQAGETVLIHGAAGGMGLAAVQVAKELGATVVATAGDDGKLVTVKECGADHVINYQKGFREQVKSFTDGRGVDVVFDPVGGDIFDESMRCIDMGARLVVVGFTAGRAAQVRTNHLLIKCASVVGIRAGSNARRNPEIARGNLDVLLGWAADGRIRTHISHRFPFESVTEAMRVIAKREVVGKAILLPDA